MEAECPNEKEGLVPDYYAKCGYCWPEFFDKGCITYREVRFCSYREKLDCTSQEEAEKIVARMNQNGKTCPVCGHVGKFRALTNFDMINEQRIIDGVINNAVNGR